MASSFDTICSNTLEEIEMIAGDYQEFVYNVYTGDGSEVNLLDTILTVFIFRYGDPSSVILEIGGEYSGSPIYQFKAIIPSASSIDLSGVYQQQPRIEFPSGKIYSPAQGKIVVFPSPSSA